eukprot:197912_1
MRGFNLVGMHNRYEKKSPQIGTRVQGKKLEEKKIASSSIPKYIFTVAFVLLFVLHFSGIVRRDDLTWSETKSNKDTLDVRNSIDAVRNTAKQDDNIHMADANTHVKDDGPPMIDNEAIVPDDDSPMIDNGAIVPDDDPPMIDNGVIVPDGTVVVEAESDGDIIPDDDSNVVEMESNGHIIKYEHDPSIDIEVNMTEKIFESAPLRENVDLEQCQKSPMDPSINETITARWGCDMFEKYFYNPEVHNTKVGSGYWRRVLRGIVGEQPVVLKALKETHNLTNRNILRHTREVSIVNAVHAQIPESESHVVPILGICGSDTISPLLEFDLGEYIMQDTKSFPFDFILELAIQAARGLRSIHIVEHGPVAHADIKPSAFLFDKEGKLYLNDLNRCRIMRRFHETDHSFQNLRGVKMQKNSKGTPCYFMIGSSNGPWRAPEEYLTEWLDEKIDVYSLGMVFWVMMTRHLPNMQHENSSQWKADIISGVRPTLYKNWHPGFRDLLKSMWAPEPADRPDAATVVQHLEGISESI